MLQFSSKLGDHFGKFLAVVSLAPFIIITAYLTLIFMVRDVRVVSYKFGCFQQFRNQTNW